MTYQYGDYAAPQPPFVPAAPPQSTHHAEPLGRTVARTAAIAIGVLGVVGGIFVEPSLLLIGAIGLVIGGLLSNHRVVTHSHHSPPVPVFSRFFSPAPWHSTPPPPIYTAPSPPPQYYPPLHPIAQPAPAPARDERIGVGDHQTPLRQHREQPASPPARDERIGVGDHQAAHPRRRAQPAPAPAERIGVGDHRAVPPQPSAPPAPQDQRISVGTGSVNQQETLAPTDRIPVGRKKTE